MSLIGGAAGASASPVVVSGLDATNTLTQTTGTAWTVGTSTNPATAQTVLNTIRTQYTQYGNLRFYTVQLYSDYDGAIEFEINGAVDVSSIVPVGYSLSAGDVSNRMVYAYRESKNLVHVNRDNDNDTDMMIMLTFAAFM